jgi:hypothetical protein
MAKRKRSLPAAAATPSRIRSEEALDERHVSFTAWAKARGVIINEVTASKLPGRGLGLVTTAPVKKGEQLLFVPEKAMFKLSAKLLTHDRLKYASPQAHLAISIMVACHDQNSPLRVWQDTWPTDEDFKHSMPLRWAESLRDLLPPSVEQPLARQQEDFDKDMAAVQAYLLEHDLKRDNFRYYWSIVNSRSFHWKPPKGRSGSMVLCPFIDYMNHGPSDTTCNVFQRPTGYEVVADRQYCK